jgi:outer membrane protein assembly factor BamB
MLPSAATADPWPGFLGPARDGTVAEKGLNLDWNRTKPRVLWTVPIGPAFSSFAVVDGKLFTQTNRGARDIVVCLDAGTGKELWSHDAAPRYLDQQNQGPGPRATPTFHEGRVYCAFPMGELVCLNAADGKPVWSINARDAAGVPGRESENYYWGLSASPLVEGKVVILQPGGAKNNSVAAFDKDTGKLVWACGGDPNAYGSPIAITAAGRRQVVVPTGRSILGVDPVKGAVLWRYTFGNKFDCTCSTPLWADNTLFVSAAYRTGAAALEIVAAAGGGVTVREKWKNIEMQNHFTNSVVIGGKLYGSHGDLGALMMRCVDLATGKLLWADRAGGRCWILPVEGKLLCLNERGSLRVVNPSATGYQQTAEFATGLTFKTWAAPAVSDGWLYARDGRNLVCVELGK